MTRMNLARSTAVRRDPLSSFVGKIQALTPDWRIIDSMRIRKAISHQPDALHYQRSQDLGVSAYSDAVTGSYALKEAVDDEVLYHEVQSKCSTFTS